MRPVSRVIACVVLMIMGTGLPALGETAPSDSQRELERITREMKDKKKDLKRANRKERSILSELETFDRDIIADRVELSDQEKRLADAESALRDTEHASREINEKLVLLKKSYASRLRALYKLQRKRSAPLFAADSLGAAVKQVKYLELIANRDRSVMTEYGSTLEQMSRRQTEIDEKKKEILGRKHAVEAQKAELETKRRKKDVVLASVRREKGLYEQTLSELRESSAGLWAMIKKDETERRSANEMRAPAPGIEPPGKQKGKLPWPVEGQVLSRFGMQRHPQFGTMVFRRGIEILTHEGQPIRAVSPGEVAYADWYKGYGKLMIIDHGNGFYTLYGNLSRLDLNKGDRVAEGQVIGLAGETGSMKGTKLYFEIRQNGEAQDPLGRLAKR
jgi:septal ring factor EnvC (AmiA/AmiB activator)